jgi:hypothetical protein
MVLLTGCKPDFQEQLDQTIYNLNAECPQQVDSETTLTGITGGQPLTVTYHYSLVHLERANVDTVLFKKAMWPGLLAYIKVSEGLKTMRENGVTFVYDYRDKANHPICKLLIGPVDYSSGTAK